MKISFIILLSLILFIQNSFANKTPDWVKNFKKSEDNTFKYFVGLSSRNTTIEDANRNAYSNTIQEIIQTEFGIKLKFNYKVENSITKIILQDDVLAESKVINIEGLTIEDKYIETFSSDGREYYNLWILLKYEKSKLSLEKNRLMKFDYSDFKSTTINNSEIGYKDSIAFGKLHVVTNPDRAQIYLNDEIIGISNASFSKVGIGTYDVTIKRNGYLPKTHKIIIAPNTETNESLNLEKEQGILFVNAYPTDSTIYLNGNKIQNKSNIILDIGEYKLKIEKKGFYSNEAVFEIYTNKTTELNQTLKEKPGVLSISSTPFEAEIYIDEIYIGKTPIINHRLEGGDHKIRLYKIGYEAEITKIYVKGDTTKSLHYSLQEKQHELTDKKIYNDGDYISDLPNIKKYFLSFGLALDTFSFDYKTQLLSQFDFSLGKHFDNTELSSGLSFGYSEFESNIYAVKTESISAKLKYIYKIGSIYLGNEFKLEFSNFNFYKKNNKINQDYDKFGTVFPSGGIILGKRFFDKEKDNVDIELGMFFNKIKTNAYNINFSSKLYLGILFNFGI